MNAAGIFLIAMALAFDFANGWHDSANSIATIVSTRVLSPRYAVLWAAFFNFVAFLIFGVAVAKTIASIIKPAVASDAVIFAALFGAIAWDIITWYFGLPTSSSHALVGGLVGAGVARSGWHVVNGGALWKTVEFIILSPVIGLILGLVFIVAIYWVMRRASPRFANRLFRRGQLLSAAALSLGHGANDAQKTMGVIAVVLLARHDINSLSSIPIWVVLAANASIALGTASGGWRIVRTMGQKITNLVPVQGFAAETAAAITLFVTSGLGIPVSTTHTITGAIVGVGSTRRLSAVRWGVAGRVVWAWFLTIPVAAGMAAIALEVVTRLH
ncbi:MAG TPA: inorganic phosphate transporter [Actinomycetota bacterium]|nr:inorganic phosphate transporter [Actinomycetota bacterium]